MEKMPSKGLHIFFMVVSFICGVLWGILSIRPYKLMSEAIECNDVDEAKRNARKIRIFFYIGIALNVLFILVSKNMNQY